MNLLPVFVDMHTCLGRCSSVWHHDVIRRYLVLAPVESDTVELSRSVREGRTAHIVAKHYVMSENWSLKNPSEFSGWLQKINKFTKNWKLKNFLGNFKKWTNSPNDQPKTENSKFSGKLQKINKQSHPKLKSLWILKHIQLTVHVFDLCEWFKKVFWKFQNPNVLHPYLFLKRMLLQEIK